MDYPNKQFLAEADWLSGHLKDPTVQVIEVTALIKRGKGDVGNNQKNIAKTICYDKRHIPGALYLDVASSYGPFNDPNGAFPMTWPPKKHFEKVMSELGISNNSEVILYASSVEQKLFNCMMWCARAWWVMHHYGVNCRILNGNLEHWIQKGYPVTDQVTEPTKANFTATDDRQLAIAYKQDVIKSLDSLQTGQVINALPEAIHDGTHQLQYGPRKGHITGSINMPIDPIVDWHTGVFANREKLHQYFLSKNIEPNQSIITYCGGGGCASMDAFALKLMGYKDVCLYDNSLNEWGADMNLPMSRKKND